MKTAVRVWDRQWSAVLVFACLWVLAPSLACADFNEGDFTYTVTDGCATVTGFNSEYEGALSIPETLCDYPVTSIGDGAFYECRGLTHVSIPDSVTLIGWSAFYDCSGLNSLSMPASLSDIGNAAFAYCSALEDITIPEAVTRIGEFAFQNCSKITHVTIPSGVQTIGDGAFSGCDLLVSVTLLNDLPFFAAYALFGDGCGRLSKITIGDGVRELGPYAFEGCYSLANVTIPSSVTNIGEGAFGYCEKLSGIFFEGNPPNAVSNVFNLTPVTVYYLPGRTGWGPEFCGCQAVLWNPQIQHDASFGIQTNRFGFNIVGTMSIPVVVEACTFMQNGLWVPVETNTLGVGGVLYFSDAAWTNYPVRFYRIRSP